MNTFFGTPCVSPLKLEKAAKITFHAGQLNLQWQHCSSSADFLTDFFSRLIVEESPTTDIAELRNSISYMANELIENAIKFRADGDMEIEAGLSDGDFVLRISHWISAANSCRFQALLAEITTGDPGDLLIARIEANALGDSDNGSGLGLLTLLNDYGARITWSFEQPDESAESNVFAESIARLNLC